MEKINAGIFLSVAETGSFRKTAEQMGYTQAGISYIIAAMEEETGLHLFIREHGGVRLSPEGEALLPGMQQIALADRRLEQTVTELQGLERGTLRVQIFDSVSIHWLPGILRRFRDDFPGIRVELISEEDSVRAEQMVYDGEADCGFFLTDVKSDLEVFPLLTENQMVILSKDHPLAGEKAFPAAKLGNYPYIGMKYDEHIGVRDIFRRFGVEPQQVYCLDNDNAAMAMVSLGLGFSIQPELLLRNVSFELVKLPLDEPQKRTIRIGTRSMETCSRACRKFIEYTLEWVKEREQV